MSCRRHHPPRTGHEEYAVAIAAGGGLDVFGAALRRKMHRLARRGCFCVILERTATESRYVQAIVTPVGVRIESVGSHYLEADGQALGVADVAALMANGWLPPAHDDGWAANWWQALPGAGAVDPAVDLLLGALVDVHGLEADESVTVTVFPSAADRFEWVPDPGLPYGGNLLPKP